MADDLRILFRVVSDDKDLTRALKTNQKELDKTNKSAQKVQKSFVGVASVTKGFGSSLKSVARTAASLAPVLAGAIAGFAVKRAIDEATALENSLLGLQRVAAATGNNVSSITEAAKELSADGIVPLSDVSGALKSLLSTGIGADKAIETFKALRNAAAFNRQGQLSLAEAVRGAADGIKNQNSIMVDNAGITKNLSILTKEYAASVGKSVADLSEQEKRLAIVNGVIKEASIFQGDYNKSLETFTGASSQASGSFRFLLAEIGNIIVQNPIVIRGISAIAAVVRNLTAGVKENASQIKQGLLNGLASVLEVSAKLVPVLNGLVKVTEVLARSLALLTAGAVGAVRSLLEFDLVSTILSGLGKTIFVAASGLLELVRIVSKLPGAAQALEAVGLSAELVEGSILKLESSLSSLDDNVSVSGITDGLKDAENASFGLIESIGGLSKRTTEGLENSKERAIEVGKSIRGVAGEIGQKIQKINEDVAKPIEKKVKLSFAQEGFANLRKEIKSSRADIAAGLISGLSKGAEGAKTVLKSAATTAATAFLGPEVGKAAGPLFDLLAQGPEKARESIRAFAQGIPDVIQSIIESIPVVIEEFANQAPLIIERLADKSDIIIERLIEKAPDIAVALARATALTLPQAVARAFFQGGKSALNKLSGINFLEKLFKFDGGGKGPVEKFLGFDFPFIAFAKGGRVPGRASTPGDSLRNDKVPALLSPGELVVPRSAMSGGASGIVNFLEQMGVAKFGFGGFVKNFFGGAFSSVSDVFTKTFGAKGGLFRSAGSVLVNAFGGDLNRAPGLLEGFDDRSLKLIGGNAKAFSTFFTGSLDSVVGEIKRLPFEALTLFTDIASSLGVPLDDLLNKGLGENVIAALNSLAKLGASFDLDDILQDLFKNPANVIKNITRSIKPVFRDPLRNTLNGGQPLQNGGVIPAGFNNDTFPARLSSGERVVPRDQNIQLQNFLDEQRSGSSKTEQILSAIAGILSTPQVVQSTVEINNREFANIILELQRTNQRTA